MLWNWDNFDQYETVYCSFFEKYVQFGGQGFPHAKHRLPAFEVLSDGEAATQTAGGAGIGHRTVFGAAKINWSPEVTYKKKKYI